MQNLNRVLDKVAAHLSRDRSERAESCKHSTSIYQNILKEPVILGENKGRFEALLGFVRNCKLVVGRPKVLRVRNSGGADYFKHKGRYILPNLVLVSGETKYAVERLWSVHCYKTSPKIETSFPDIFRHWQISNYSSGHLSSIYDGFVDDITVAFERDAGENWTNILRDIDRIWNETSLRLEEIVNDTFGKRGSRDREKLRTNLSKVLHSTRGLIDAPPEAILTILKLGYNEIELLARFSSQHKADLHIVELEDIIQAQRESQVRNVMDS